MSVLFKDLEPGDWLFNRWRIALVLKVARSSDPLYDVDVDVWTTELDSSREERYFDRWRYHDSSTLAMFAYELVR